MINMEQGSLGSISAGTVDIKRPLLFELGAKRKPIFSCGKMGHTDRDSPLFQSGIVSKSESN